jgi:hypothetical protein
VVLGIGILRTRSTMMLRLSHGQNPSIRPLSSELIGYLGTFLFIALPAVPHGFQRQLRWLAYYRTCEFYFSLVRELY